MSAPLVSTVVLTRDRPDSLRRCLGSLRANGYRPFEIVIIDNGSEATRRETREWLAGWGAEGEFVVSIDDDCEAATDMLERVVRPWAWLGIEFWKLVSTRLAIPWITRVARRGAPEAA